MLIYFMWMSLLPEGVCVCGLVSSGQKTHVSSLGTRAIDGSKSVSGCWEQIPGHLQE